MEKAVKIQPQKNLDRVRIGSVLFSNLTWDEAIQSVEELIRADGKAYVVTPNVDHVVQAVTDPCLRKIYLEAPLVLADGMPIIWAARLLGSPIKDKISGSDFLVRFCPVAVKKGYRLFFLGGKDDAAKISARILTQRYPGLQIVGVCSPSIGFELDPETNAPVLAQINRTTPDVVFVGLGTPKQEKWIYKNRNYYPARVSFPVGAGFDFVSGKSRRAPHWMREAGLEWFWRLMWDPKRLARRYLIRDLKFFPLLWRQMVYGRKNKTI